MSKSKAKGLNLLKIKSAISEFLIKTQKLVKSVEPNAEIIIPKSLPQKRYRQTEESPEPPTKLKQEIIVPQFRSKHYLARDQKK